jgi:hypothetical protein
LHLCAKSVPRRKAFSSYQFFEPCWTARDVAVSVLLVLLVLQMLLMLLLQMLLLLQLVLVLQVVLVLLVLLELVLLVLMQLLLMLQSLNLEGVALLLIEGRTQVAQGRRSHVRGRQPSAYGMAGVAARAATGSDGSVAS